MTSNFEGDPQQAGFGRFLFNRRADQLDLHLDAHDVERLTRLANLPREQLTAEDRER